jgi:hypothetical protein
MESQFHAMEAAAARPVPPDRWPMPQIRKRILVVSRTGGLTAEVISAVLKIAQRLGLDLIALYTDPLPRNTAPPACRPAFIVKARINGALLMEQARRRGVHAQIVIAPGKVARTVADLIAASRGIAFVILEPDIALREVRSLVSVPVFAAVVETGRLCPSSTLSLARRHGIGRAALKFFNIHSPRGGEQMAENVSRKKNVQKTFVFGAAAAAIYAAVFYFADPLMSLATRGKFYALVPVATVFLFSYIHGNFTSYFWSALGIEASKRTGVQPKAVKPVKRKDTRPRARLSV